MFVSIHFWFSRRQVAPYCKTEKIYNGVEERERCYGIKQLLGGLPVTSMSFKVLSVDQTQHWACDELSNFLKRLWADYSRWSVGSKWRRSVQLSWRGARSNKLRYRLKKLLYFYHVKSRPGLSIDVQRTLIAPFSPTNVDEGRNEGRCGAVGSDCSGAKIYLSKYTCNTCDATE